MAGMQGSLRPRQNKAEVLPGAVSIVIACIPVYFFVIKPKKAAVAPDQQAPTSTNKHQQAGQQKPSD
jgi:hypothetical protein